MPKQWKSPWRWQYTRRIPKQQRGTASDDDRHVIVETLCLQFSRPCYVHILLERCRDWSIYGVWSGPDVLTGPGTAMVPPNNATTSNWTVWCLERNESAQIILLFNRRLCDVQWFDRSSFVVHFVWITFVYTGQDILMHERLDNSIKLSLLITDELSTTDTLGMSSVEPL